MNDEYLWNKTGEDPEIEKFEKALAIFRYRETEPPIQPVAATQANTSRWRFTIAFAASACAAMVIAAGAWFQIAEWTNDYDVTFVHSPEPATIENPAEYQPPAVQPPAPRKQPARRIDHEAQTVSVRRKSTVTTPARRNGTPVLTKQERYAYEQLMIALAISSSKLNIVRNTINGVEETENSPKQNNR